MAGRFVVNETREIHAPWWDENETVTIKRFNYGDRQYLAGASIRTEMKGARPGDAGKSELVAGVNIAEMNLAILERGIVRWTLEDDRGRVVRPTRRWIERLSEEDADFILEAINELNPSRQRDDEQEADFRGDGGDSGTDE